jgi:hypothetical protein
VDSRIVFRGEARKFGAFKGLGGSLWQGGTSVDILHRICEGFLRIDLMGVLDECAGCMLGALETGCSDQVTRQGMFSF